ncbi:MAG: hypothetical protein AAGC67_01235 [Myxococcota bacterium]
MRAVRPRSSRIAVLTAALLMAASGPAGALEFPELEWEGTRAQEVTNTVVDLTIVRPVATVRVIVGGLLFVPAAILSAPMGREGYEGALDTLITAPSEYAFERELGEL